MLGLVGGVAGLDVLLSALCVKILQLVGYVIRHPVYGDAGRNRFLGMQLDCCQGGWDHDQYQEVSHHYRTLFLKVKGV